MFSRLLVSRSLGLGRSTARPLLRTAAAVSQQTLPLLRLPTGHTSFRDMHSTRVLLRDSPYFNRTPGPLTPHPISIDHPYPAPGSDGFLTISFYSFFAIPSEQVQRARDKIQNEWSKQLGIVGRIYICEQGINAQLSVPQENTEGLRVWLETTEMFRGRIPKFNWAIDHRKSFKALHVRVRPLVATGSPLSLDELANEPEYLGPEQWETELNEIKNSGKQPLLIDMRNNYEFRIGRFEGAVCPDVDTFREEMAVVRDLCKDQPKHAPIHMYCTGGIRCSVAGAILKSEGYTNVKTLQGGVIAYGKHVRAQKTGKSIFHGKNFTFDKRLGEEVTSEILSKCDQCGGPCDVFTNCANTSCNLLFVQCEACAEKHKHTCGNDLCIERAAMSHDELVKNRMPPLWDYRTRVRPEEAFGDDGIARPKQKKMAA